jgi:hypothetical protein
MPLECAASAKWAMVLPRLSELSPPRVTAEVDFERPKTLAGAASSFGAIEGVSGAAS